MDQHATTKNIPSRLTLQSETSYRAPQWMVQSQVQGTVYGHRWAGTAGNASEASRKALDAARRAWPGFSIVIRSVVEVQ